MLLPYLEYAAVSAMKYSKLIMATSIKALLCIMDKV